MVSGETVSLNNCRFDRVSPCQVKGTIQLRILLTGCLLLAGIGLLVVLYTNPPPAPDADLERTLIPVSVMVPQVETLEIVDEYAGMIEPLRRYNLSFNVSGHIHSLGKNKQGVALDVGDRVEQDQIMGQLIQSRLLVQLREAGAALERAQDQVQRTGELRKTRAVSDQEYQDALRDLALFEARVDLVRKGIEETYLIAPTPGVISRRFVNPGETVAPNEAVFELLNVSEVLLVLGVPEGRILRLKEGMKVQVSLWGNHETPQITQALEGVIRRIAPSADQDSGLFRIEVLLPNSERLIRPGLVARARIVIEITRGFRFRPNVIILDQGEVFLFSVDENQRARRHRLNQVVFQDDHVILRKLPVGVDTVVVQGQRRLAPGVKVEMVDGLLESTSYSTSPSTNLSHHEN